MFNKFNKSCLTKYLNPHDLKSVKERTIWSFMILKDELNIDRLTISNVATFLTEIIEIDTSPQAIRHAINDMPSGFLNKNKLGYKLMEKGRKFLLIEDKNNAIIINSGETFSSKKIFSEEIIKSLSGTIKLCDPYIDVRLLDLLSEINPACQIQVLSCNLIEKNKGVFSRSLTDLNNEGINIEVKLYDKSVLHDRYILDDKNMWLIGHSIKDLGKKECYIVKVGEDLRGESLNLFNRRWKIANKL